MDPRIRQALDEAGVSHYYGVKVIGDQVVILPVGGPAIYWTIPGSFIVLPVPLPAGDLRRIAVADLRELASAHGIDDTLNKPDLIQLLKLKRAEEA